MKNSTLKFLLLVSVILNAVILATVGYSYYQHTCRRGIPFGPERRQFLRKELSLTPAQTDLLMKQQQAFHARISAMKQQIFQQRLQLLNLMQADKPDMKQIDQSIEGIGDMQENIEKAVVSHIMDVKTHLNTNQQKKFFGFIKSIITRREHEGYGPHGPRR